MKTLLNLMDMEMIPTSIGGNFELYNEPFDFDLTENGPLYYSGAPLSSIHIPLNDSDEKLHHQLKLKLKQQQESAKMNQSISAIATDYENKNQTTSTIPEINTPKISANIIKQINKNDNKNKALN